MSAELEQLKKEDLVKVIATMHDVIQNWNNGWGLSSCLIKVGNICTSECVKNDDWSLPKV
jgi:hypothetical protein